MCLGSRGHFVDVRDVPKWLIECRRLQHAATTLFVSPDTDLSPLAAELDYTGYSHFFRQYRRVLGKSPKATRERGRRAAETRNAAGLRRQHS